MARKLTEDMALETLEDEILYTQAAIQADPDAADLYPMTTDWLTWYDGVAGADRTLRQTIANTDAVRMVSNQRLDYACLSFSRDLLYDVGDDRSDPRWTQFFPVSPSSFVKQGLSGQVSTVKGWLQGSTDPVLETHRADLTQWCSSVDAALTSTSALATLRGQQWQKRAQLAADLTNSRDALQRALAERAVERKLPRDWPATFFRAVSHSSASGDTGGSSGAAGDTGGTNGDGNTGG